MDPAGTDGECPLLAPDHKPLYRPDGGPACCANHIGWHGETVALDADVMNAFGKCSSGFYHDLYGHIVNGRELFMRPVHVKAEMAILNEIERQSPPTQRFERP